jgi:hypothetical protein
VSPHGSPRHSMSDAEEGAETSKPTQKRRRVTRACDECRRKKIKCDGKQPCTHCTVYSYGKCEVWSHFLCSTVLMAEQIARTINHRIEGEMLHRSMLRRWRVNSNGQTQSSKSSSPMRTSKILIWNSSFANFRSLLHHIEPLPRHSLRRLYARRPPRPTMIIWNQWFDLLASWT